MVKSKGAAGPVWPGKTGTCVVNRGHGPLTRARAASKRGGRGQLTVRRGANLAGGNFQCRRVINAKPQRCAGLLKNNFQISPLWENVAQNSGPGRQQDIGPDHCGGGIGDHERPEFQLGHAGDQRNSGAQGAHEAADENRPAAPAMKQVQRFFDFLFEAAEKPEMNDFMVVVETDPPRDPIPQHRAHECAQPGRKQADMAGADHPAQGYQQNGARNDEGHADKGFRKSDGKGDGKDPIGMGLCGKGYPRTRFIGKRMKKIEHPSPALVPAPVLAQVPDRMPTYRYWTHHASARHFRHISPLTGGYICGRWLRI
jgi:hypothetical protein